MDLQYQAKSSSKPRRVVAKIEWHRGELFPRVNFVVTNSGFFAGKVVKVYNGRGDVENRIKETCPKGFIFPDSESLACYVLNLSKK